MMRPSTNNPPVSPVPGSSLMQATRAIVASPSGEIAPEIGDTDKGIPSTAANADNSEASATPAQRLARERKLWVRTLSPVRTRSNTDSLPGSSKSPYAQNTPQEMRDATPPKPRTPPRTTSAKKSGPSRKPKALKAVTVGRAGKRARKSLTTEDKQVVDPNIDKDDKGSGVGGKDAELDFENEITTPSVIGNGASSELSDPWDTDACARSDEYDLGERVKTPGASDHGASRSAGYFCEQDTPAKYNGKDKVRTPDGVPAGSPVLSDPQGSAGARKRNSRVIQAASTGYGRKRMKTEPTEDEVEDRSNVKNRHEKSPSLLNSYQHHHPPSGGANLEAPQNFGHSDQLSEVANVEASLDIKHAIIVPVSGIALEAVISQIKALKRMPNVHTINQNVTHMFIYLGSPFSQIQFMVSIVPDSELEKYLFGDVQYYPWYKIQSLWQLVEPIPLKTLIEVYGYEGAPKRDVDVSPELLVAYPLASMQKLF